jgi:hypothetical protein
MRSFSFALSAPPRILSVSLVWGRDVGCGVANCGLIAGDGIGVGCGGVEVTETVGWGADDASGISVLRCLCSYLNLVSVSVRFFKKPTVPSASCKRGARNWTFLITAAFVTPLAIAL